MLILGIAGAHALPHAFVGCWGVLLTLGITDAQDVQQVPVQLQPAAPEALGRHRALVEVPQGTCIALSTVSGHASRLMLLLMEAEVPQGTCVGTLPGERPCIVK